MLQLDLPIKTGMGREGSLWKTPAVHHPPRVIVKAGRSVTVLVKEASREVLLVACLGIAINGGAAIARLFEARILEAAGYSVSDAGCTRDLFVALTLC